MARAKRIAITGASRGLGLELAGQWLAAGNEVAVLARRPEESEGLWGLGEKFPERLFVCTCDVPDDASVASARRTIGEHWD